MGTFLPALSSPFRLYKGLLLYKGLRLYDGDDDERHNNANSHSGVNSCALQAGLPERGRARRRLADFAVGGVMGVVLVPSVRHRLFADPLYFDLSRVGRQQPRIPLQHELLGDTGLGMRPELNHVGR